MPGVVAFVGASILGGIGVGAASAALIMGVGSAAIALTVASARRAAKLDDQSDAGYSVGQQVSIRSTEAPRNIVYGEANVGGVFTYVNSAGADLRSLYYELVHTGHEIETFIGWYLDEKYIPVADVDTAGDGSVDTNTGGHGLDDVAAGPVLYLRGHLGTSSQAVDSMLDTAFTDIGTNHRHRECAKSVIRCDLLAGYEDKWNGRPPAAITAVVRGMKVYDPRLDSTFSGGSGAHRLATPSTWEWSDNPALIWANYRILAKPLGPGWDTDRIDWQSVFDAADDCDALADIPTSTTEKRFRCDLVVDTAMEPGEVVAQILATMAGRERHFSGQWHVYAGVWPTPDFALDEDDLVGPVQFRKQPDTASQDRYNQVKGEFYDRDRLWKLSPFLTVTDTSLRTARDNGRTLTKHLKLEGVSREYQAQRLGMRALRQAEDSGILVFPAGYSAANIRVGDTGTVTIDEFGWSEKTFRCVNVKAIDFVGYELTLKEDESVNYDDPEEGEYSTRTAAGTITFGTVLPWYSQAEGGDLAFLDTVDTPQIEDEAATEVAMTTDGTGVTASATDETAQEYGCVASATIDATTDVFEVSCHGISTTSTSGSPGSPATLLLLRYDTGSGFTGGMGLNLPRALNTTAPFTVVGSVTGLTPGSIDFAVEAYALEVGGTGTVNHALTQLTMVVTKVKR